jgi:sugar lactone lactonase YvrE
VTRVMSRRLAGLLLAVGMLVATLPAASAGAAGHTEVLYSWTNITEGIAMDADGNLYVSHSPAGELWKIEPGAAAPEVFGAVPNFDVGGGFGLIGLAVGPDGAIYGGSSAAVGNGVWRFDPVDGSASLVPGTEAIAIPNAIAFDRLGTMYVSDTPIGAVWRVRRGGVAEPWIVDDLLAGTGAFGFGPLGANGVVVDGRTVYVSVTEQGTIVGIPILRDGSAGTPYVHAGDAALFGIDGIALAANGEIFASIIGGFAVARVATDGSVDLIASAAAGDAGVLDTSSLVFGTQRDNRKDLFIVNFGTFSQGDFGEDPRPAVTRIDVGVPGARLP